MRAFVEVLELEIAWLEHRKKRVPAVTRMLIARHGKERTVEILTVWSRRKSF